MTCEHYIKKGKTWVLCGQVALHSFVIQGKKCWFCDEHAKSYHQGC